MKKTTVSFVLVGALFLAYFVASPYVFVSNLRDAVLNKDREALAEMIDFQSVRESLKEQMSAVFAKQMQSDPTLQNNMFAALGASIVGGMINTLVDKMVTPSGMVALMSGDGTKGVAKPKSGEGAPVTEDKKKLFGEATLSYTGWNSFVVRVDGKGDNTKRTDFILKRSGLTWRLVDVSLPIGE